MLPKVRQPLHPSSGLHAACGTISVLSLLGSLPVSQLDIETLEGRDWLSSLHHPDSELGS